ncbi:C40 family peptidase [Cohnella panacarvi]|uniref:C40 family peptidase n=1 Tax=Cohnella panacarvi TaxID=400776 RepID=UPI000479E0E9|nr:C40 family peptidase [Cohnella panacarvi]
MRKGLLIVTSALAMLMSVPTFASAATGGSSANIVSTVSFRSGPSTSSTVMKYLKAGDKVTIVEETNSYWYKVKDSNGQIGYVSSNEKYIDVVEQAVTTTNAVIVSSVSFRKGPSTSDERIRYLKKDEKVTITSKMNSYWYAVKDAGGVSGYISTSADYVKVTGSIPAPPAGSDTNPDTTASNAVIVASVSFRDAPSTSGTRMRYLQKDEKVRITKKVNDYWYAITDAKGVAGYISTSGSYVKVTGDIPKPPAQNLPIAQQVELVIAAGNKYLGTPYEFGSDRGTTATFDCSDFVRQAFKDALELVLPADSRQQGEYVRANNSVSTDWRTLKRGDLMFFMDYAGSAASNYADKSPFGETITHVGIYLGNGQILHTYSKESGGVRVDHIEGTAWEHRFLYGGSAL